MRALALTLGVLLVMGGGSARAVGRDGEGRIGVAGGGMWISNNGFEQDARADGFDVTAPYELARHILAAFANWVDERFELSLEGTYHHVGANIAGQQTLTIDVETIMATLRYVPFTDWDIWPYIGGSFGYGINTVGSPLNQAWGGCSTGCGNWSAVGYVESLEIGTGWDLSTHFGVSAELRYTFDLLQSPFNASLNAAGLSVLVGVYLRIPRSIDEVGAVLPPSP